MSRNIIFVVMYHRHKLLDLIEIIVRLSLNNTYLLRIADSSKTHRCIVLTLYIMNQLNIPHGSKPGVKNHS
jgi:hypothetical protein